MIERCGSGGTGSNRRNRNSRSKVSMIKKKDIGMWRDGLRDAKYISTWSQGEEEWAADESTQESGEDHMVDIPECQAEKPKLGFYVVSNGEPLRVSE